MLKEIIEISRWFEATGKNPRKLFGLYFPTKRPYTYMMVVGGNSETRRIKRKHIDAWKTIIRKENEKDRKSIVGVRASKSKTAAEIRGARKALAEYSKSLRKPKPDVQ